MRIVDHLADVYVQLKPSSIEGVGCFAIRTIPPSTDPFKNPSNFDQYRTVTLDRSDFNAHPKVVQLMERYCYSTESEIEVPEYGFNLVYLENYLNHSTDPNLEWVDGRFRSMRSIEEGEELTFNYDELYGCKHDYTEE